ncbi:MAG: DUF1499 domain-containing protein [Hyphomicrobiaceae bacterium]
MQDAPTFRSPLARFSRIIAVFSLQLVVAAIVLHRLLSLPTPVALSIFLMALVGAAIAVLLALASFVAIWRDGRLGALSATAGLVVGLGLLAWPAGLIPISRSMPAIHDITTDTAAPPSFVALAARRTGLANGAGYGGAEVAKLQLAAYPDVRPVIVPRSVADTWDVLGDTVRRLHWQIASETPPTAGQPGYIEAVDRTLILGFYDDIVVRVLGDARETRIDVRSASRYGKHDFGRNAKRITSLFNELKLRLEETLTGTDGRRRRGRRDKAVPRRGKGDPVAHQSRTTSQARARRGSRREPR